MQGGDLGGGERAGLGGDLALGSRRWSCDSGRVVADDAAHLAVDLLAVEVPKCVAGGRDGLTLLEIGSVAGRGALGVWRCGGGDQSQVGEEGEDNGSLHDRESVEGGFRTGYMLGRDVEVSRRLEWRDETGKRESRRW